ncbi:MAG: urease accessory UreF family protein [Pseudomonadota bacterium]
MATATDDLLTLSQWMSPAFPVSAYAYSQGLEVAVADGRLGDARAVEAWIDGVLAAGSLRTDAVLLALTLRRIGKDGALADLARALAGSAHRWRETRDQGAAFAETLWAMGETSVPKVAYPVAMGIAARRLDLPVRTICGLFVQAGAASLVSAAVRLVPLGQAAGQGVLARLAPAIAACADAAAGADGPEVIAQAAFAADLAAMAHETLQPRLFRS